DRSIVGHSAKVLYSINKHFLKFASLNDDGKSKKEVVTGQDIDQFHAYLTRLHNDELFAKTVTMAHAIPFSGYLTSKIPAFKEQIDKASFVSEIENEVGWSNIKFPSSSPLEQGAFGWMNPKHSIVPQACTQSEMGDCVVVSSMAAIAKTHPDLIQKMIKENKDGSFDVTLPGEPKHPYHVTLSDTEKVIYEIPNDEGMWPAIVKKAYGMHAMNITQANEHRRKSAETPWWAEMLHPGTRDAVKLQENANCPADYIGAGNFPEHVLGTLTGRPTNSKWVGYTKLEDLDQKLKEIVDKKIPAVACSNPIILGNPLVPSKYPDVFSAHGYTVMGYDPKKKVVELRNPWGMGQKDINSHGVFKLPLDEFKDKFLWLSYTTDKQEWNFDTTVAVIRIVDKVIDRLDDSNKQKK
ncbi:MAG: hypothetical protein K2X29_14710, partial [Candidatus Obscuribacterales bacterium]|nr:hypothetical protein [Candidatus Obscuribacterales bacterium]